ncbi:MAG: rhodanese-like domain-containing protein [Coriobacteriaceae bacterium]|nr:rhodanese-like domain-containing protein [Coriobacteriaceae bacterium]
MSLFSSFFGPSINELAAQAAETPGSILVDVRSPDEFRGGHITGAMNVPLVALPANATRRLPNKQAPLFVYCLSGARSAQACRELARQGYENVTDMGGINRWTGPLAQ